MMVLLTLSMLACRPAPIEYPDSTWNDLDTGSSAVDQFLGPNPYEEGDARLSLGVFYEGGFSKEIPIDEVNSFFYIWVQEGTETPTLSQSPTVDRVEGNLADEITAGGLGWFGSGISWNSAQDLSQWKTMHLSVKSSDVVLEGIEVGMGGQTSSVGSCSGVGVRQNWESLSDYGFVADGEWHHVEVPLDELDLCLEFEQIVEPFMFLMTGLSFDDSGSKILFDNLYFTED